MTSVRKYAIASIRQLTESTNSYKFKAVEEEKVQFQAGEFIYLHILDNDKIVKRCYSVASAPEDDIELCIKMVNGELTGRLAKMKEGDIVGIEKGGGHFAYKGEKKCGFIAGGVGMAPVIGILREIAKKKIEGEFVFFCSSKTEEEILYREELAELSKRNPGIKVVHTLTREKWKGECGRVDAEMIKRNLPDASDYNWWICGSMAMLKSMREHLTSLGVDPRKIRMEGWG